jgi:integrase
VAALLQKQFGLLDTDPIQAEGQLALKQGIPSKVVAEVLGHASARTTEDIYQHVTAGMQGDATARVAALLTR